MPNSKSLFTVTQAAKILGVSSKTLRRWDADGILIPQRTAGNQRRYLAEELSSFQNHQNHQETPDTNPVTTTGFSTNTKMLFGGLGLTGLATILLLKAAVNALPAHPVPATGLSPEILGLSDNPSVFNVNVAASFAEDVTIAGDLSAENILYGLTAGSGISVTSSQNPKITNSGVLSLAGKTGTLTLEAGSGITIDGLKITNSDAGSGKNIFKTISVSGQSDVVADGSTDTLTFAGSGVSITTDATNDKVTFTVDYSQTGWTDGGTSVYLTTSTDSVGIGTSSPTSNLHVSGSTNLAGTVVLGSSSSDSITFTGRIANGTSIYPNTDLGSDLGSSSLRFNNIWAANVNSNASASFSGQTIFTYAPTATTYAESSVMINPTSSVANGFLLGVGIAGYQRAGIDEDGDLILGYSDAVSAPATAYPLDIYNHSSTRVAYIDTSGNLTVAGTITSGGTTGSIKLPDGTASAPSLAFTNDTDTGIYRIGDDTLGFAVGGGSEIGLSTTSLYPGTAEGTSLGGTSNEFEALYLGDNAGAYFGLDQDWHMAYDEATDDRLELTTSGTSGMLISTAATTGTGLLATFDSVTQGTGMSISADALTTGNAFYLESTSTAFSSGNLMSLYWNPGSATTATGDVLRVNIGSNATVGNLLNILDNGTSLFSVSETVITSALPHAFTAAGDVAIAYDIVLTNQTASEINSYGPLQITSGESFENLNLTLKTYGTGDLLADVGGNFLVQSADPAIVLDTSTTTDTDFWIGITEDAGSDDDDYLQIGDGTTIGSNVFITIDTSGKTGIGNSTPASLLHIDSTNTATFGKALAIFNHDESQELLTASAAGVSKFMVSNSGQVYMGVNTTLATSTAVCWEGETVNGVTLYKLGDCTGTPGDLAEFYPTSATDVPQPGDVVSISNPIGTYQTADGKTHEAFTVAKSSKDYDAKTIGVVSTKAWQVMGEDILEWAENAVPVALVGRVPVKIASSSAAISPGDLLTSSTEGRASKATSEGITIGKALEAWTPESGRDTILVYLNLTDKTASPVAPSLTASSTTGGIAFVPRLGTSVDIVFTQSYQTAPIISLTPVLTSIEDAVVLTDVKLAAANVTPIGFTIILAEPLLRDLQIHWTATSVDQPTTTVGKSPLGETPTPSLTPTPTLTPTLEPTITEATESGN